MIIHNVRTYYHFTGKYEKEAFPPLSSLIVFECPSVVGDVVEHVFLDRMDDESQVDGQSGIGD